MDEEEENTRIIRQHVEVLFKTKNDLQNDVQTFEKRGEQRFEPREEERVELATPTSNMNLANNHPPE